MGGWIASDEASVNFEDLIMNIRKGQEFAKNEFGVHPRIAWMLDAFGHSSANAALFHDMGFEATFFTRIDDHLRDYLYNNSMQTFMW